MAAVMGETYPDLFSAVGIHSGLPYQAAADVPSAFAVMRNGKPLAGPSTSPFAPDDGPRTIVFHGEADATVHPANGERLFQNTCRQQGMTVETETVFDAARQSFHKQIARKATGETCAEYWSIPGGGHAWSGGDARGTYVTAGGPDASREMLRFFLARDAKG